MSTNVDTTDSAKQKITKKGVWFSDFAGTSKFIEYLNNKLLHEYIIWKQSGLNNSHLKTMDSRLKHVNLLKSKSNKKVDSLVIKAHEAYKELIIEMNWDEEISFIQAMKSTRFGYFYYRHFQKKFRPWFSAEEHEEYCANRQNLNRDYTNTIFGKYWMNSVDRKNVINFLNSTADKKKKDYISFFDLEINEIISDLNHADKKFFPSMDRQIINRTPYKKLGISIEMLNKPIFIDVDFVTSRIFKKYNPSPFHKKLFIFKIYDFIWNIHFCIKNLIAKVIIDKQKEIRFIEENIDVIGRIVMSYFIKSLGDVTYYLRDARKGSGINSLKEFIFNLELIDNEHIQKIGKILCNILEGWLNKKPK